MKNQEETTSEEPKEIKTLIDGIFEEMNRVRTIIKEYESLPNGVGKLAAGFMNIDIKFAELALRRSDVLMMLAAYGKLKSWEM